MINHNDSTKQEDHLFQSIEDSLPKNDSIATNYDDFVKTRNTKHNSGQNSISNDDIFHFNKEL